MRYFNEASVSGDCGFMDQQAALRWVQRSIAQFGGNPSNVTIAGEFAGGTSVLAQLVSPGARGLFERAIVESGSFALKQTSLADAETAGEAFAAKAGCADQTAALDLRIRMRRRGQCVGEDARPDASEPQSRRSPYFSVLSATKETRTPRVKWLRP